MKRLTAGLGLDLSSLRLREQFSRLVSPLPGCGTLICRTRLRDLADTSDSGNTEHNAALVIEGDERLELQTSCEP